MEDNIIKPSDWLRSNPESDHFDPFQGLVQFDQDANRNIRYGISISGVNLLVPEQTLSEVVINPTIYPLPNTPHWLPGLINLRGNLVPVFDLDAALALAAGDKQDRKLLVIDRGERAFGIYIDGNPRALDFDGEGIEQTGAPGSVPDALAVNVDTGYRIGDEVWLEVGFDDLITQLTTGVFTENPETIQFRN